MLEHIAVYTRLNLCLILRRIWNGQKFLLIFNKCDFGQPAALCHAPLKHSPANKMTMAFDLQLGCDLDSSSFQIIKRTDQITTRDQEGQ